MSAPENLVTQMRGKTNEQLSAMLQRPEDWLPEALEAARAELRQRGIDPSTIQVVSPPVLEGQPLFFAVSTLKLVVMSTVTCGLYEVHWFHKNSWHIKWRTQSDIMPFWRAVFSAIFCYPCFRQVKNMAASRGGGISGLSSFAGCLLDYSLAEFEPSCSLLVSLLFVAACACSRPDHH